MKWVQKDMVVRTIGLGKVMSAGVLLLAAGTKGERYIGKNTKVMIHNIAGGIQGSSFEIQNEMRDMLETQKRYIHCLSKETKLSKADIKNIFNQKQNVYISARTAIKYGICDKMI